MLERVRGYRRADLGPDVVAGITGATILVPQSMAYAAIAGWPPVVGLYASVFPVLVHALLVSVHDDVRDVLDASGFSDLVGVDCYFASDEEAVAHLEGGTGPAAGA